MNIHRANLIAKALVQGKTQSEALAAAGYKPDPLRNTRYCNHSLVLDRIEYYRNRIANKLDIVLADITEPLQKVINDPNAKHRDVIAACVALANITGLTKIDNPDRQPLIQFNFTVVNQEEIESKKAKILEGVIVHEEKAKQDVNDQEPTDNTITTETV